MNARKGFKKMHSLSLRLMCPSLKSSPYKPQKIRKQLDKDSLGLDYFQFSDDNIDLDIVIIVSDFRSLSDCLQILQISFLLIIGSMEADERFLRRD